MSKKSFFDTKKIYRVLKKISIGKINKKERTFEDFLAKMNKKRTIYEQNDVKERKTTCMTIIFKLKRIHTGGSDKILSLYIMCDDKKCFGSENIISQTY